MITYHKTLTVTIDCSVLNEEKIIDALCMIKGVLKVDPYLSNNEKVCKVYKLVSKRDPNTVYVGSTRSRLSQRFGGHVNEMQLYPESDKSKWLKDNTGYVEILPLAIADSEDDILRLEEEQMIRYIKLGYNVLNRQYPKTGKRYSDKDSKWKNFPPGHNPENARRMLECIEHWIKTKDSFPAYSDLRQELSDMSREDLSSTFTSLGYRKLIETANASDGSFRIPANAFVMDEEP